MTKQDDEFKWFQEMAHIRIEALRIATELNQAKVQTTIKEVLDDTRELEKYLVNE